MELQRTRSRAGLKPTVGGPVTDYRKTVVPDRGLAAPLRTRSQRRYFEPVWIRQRRLSIEDVEEGLDDIEGHREDHGRVVFATNLRERLQRAQLHCGRH